MEDAATQLADAWGAQFLNFSPAKHGPVTRRPTPLRIPTKGRVMDTGAARSRATSRDLAPVRRRGTAEANSSAEPPAQGLDSHEECRCRLHHSLRARATKFGSSSDGAVLEVEIAGFQEPGVYSRFHPATGDAPPMRGGGTPEQIRQAPPGSGDATHGNQKGAIVDQDAALGQPTANHGGGCSQGHDDKRRDCTPHQDASRRVGNYQQRQGFPCDAANDRQRLEDHSDVRAQLAGACAPSGSSRRMRPSHLVAGLGGIATGGHEAHPASTNTGIAPGDALDRPPTRLEVASPTAASIHSADADGLAFQRLALSVRLLTRMRCATSILYLCLLLTRWEALLATLITKHSHLCPAYVE